MNQNQFCMVCSWMENGNILSYTKENPEANRLRLVGIDYQWTSEEANSRCLVVDRCGKRAQVPSSDGLSAREYSRGEFYCHGC